MKTLNEGSIAWLAADTARLVHSILTATIAR